LGERAQKSVPKKTPVKRSVPIVKFNEGGERITRRKKTIKITEPVLYFPVAGPLRAPSTTRSKIRGRGGPWLTGNKLEERGRK